jgi:hypothetical protein
MDSTLALYILSKCICITGITIRPSKYRWMLWLPIAAINTYCYFSASNNPFHLQLLIDLLTASDYILLTNVQHELHQVEQQEPISSFGLWTRFRWAVWLLLCPRGVGWTHEPRLILPPHPNLTRMKFIQSRLISLIVVLIGSDIASIIVSNDPGFSKHAPPFNQQSLLWRVRATALFFFRLRSTVTLHYYVAALISVGTTLSEPSLWPDFFGRWSEAYTVRRFWG